MTPCLQALYADLPGDPTKPKFDAILTIAPPPWRSIWPISNFMQSQTPLRLVETMRSPVLFSVLSGQDDRASDCRVVHRAVEPSETIDRPPNERLDPPRLRRIDNNSQAPATLAGYHLERSCPGGFVAVSYDHARPFASHRKRCSLADTRTGTRDEHDLRAQQRRHNIP
jgi:hypothetical protein